MRFFTRIYTIILVVIALIITLVWLWGYKQNLPAPTARTNDEFVSAILATHSELFSKDNQPIFTIKNAKKPTANWYILQLAPKEKGGPESYIVINDPYFGSEYMNVALGPESKFSRKELQSAQILIPDAVMNTLRDENAL